MESTCETDHAASFCKCFCDLWEHEGMMDKQEYARNAVRKIELYQKNGIYPGERLILTFETEQSMLNQNILEKLVEKYL